MKRFIPLALCVGFIGSAVCGYAFTPSESPSFSENKIDKTPLGLIPPPTETILEQPKIFKGVPQNHPTVDPQKLRGELSYPTPIIVPDNSVDYKLTVITPDPAVDYKLTVKSVSPADAPSKKLKR